MRGPACPTFEELSQLFSARNREVIAAHLSTCATCARAWSDLEVLREAALEIPTRSVSATEAIRMEDALVTAALLPTRETPRWARWIAPAAAAAIAAGATAFFMTSSPSERVTIVEAERGARYEQFARATDGASEVVRVRDGRLAIAAAPEAAVDRVEVVTGDGTIEMTGSSFDVVVVDDRLTEVFVRSGQVAVHVPDGPTRIVRLGERWTRSDAGGRPSAPRSSASSSVGVEAPSVASGAIALEASGAEAEPGAPPAPSDASDSEGPAAGSRGAADASGSARSVARERLGSANRGAPHASAATGDRRSSRGDSGVPGTSESARDRGPPGASGAATVEHAPESATAAGDATPDPTGREGTPSADEVASTDAPATPPLPTPAEAAFASGWRALRDGDPRAAAEQFAEVLEHQAGGALAEDARYWRAVALARARDPEATDAMRAYLAHHTSGRRAPEVALMLAWRRLDDGDESGARALFERALRTGDERVSAAARRGLDRLGPRP